ncbi:lysine-2,3-aminomutase-like protein [Methylocystis sp. JR02]|uniref:lysine-2,3-aminomutase-like protein n=1 Tax=Methylocystis sp. JR02 TaxID=3046284 RepID=UPI0024B9521D|nr:lysine-2,3-aminomutase-like protein [Methylocystis sp. JR02]MDJ0447627.1 lysine-2,3-aminomutase-like protein [Methylocystis sp. JR02]
MALQHDPRPALPARTLASVADLASAGLIPAKRAAALAEVEARYSVAVTPEIAGLIDPSDPADPIARQFLPDAREIVTLPQELTDPIGDTARSPVPGIVHRYPDRVLLKLLTVCPVYCRFCFRRESVGRGKGDLLGEAEVEAALDYIAANPQIFEVILTGGDPLMLSARRLAQVARRLAAIPHVAVLRVHTRAPTAAPDLVTPERLAALRESGKALYVALHVNHARELSAGACTAIARLRAAGATLLSQTVLLAGVNDDAAILEQLMRALLAQGVKPYYLHHPDLAPGTGHFRTSIAAGKVLHAELARRITGIGLPSYVLDIPGGFGKIPVSALEPDGAGSWRVLDRAGRLHLYRDDL